MRCLSLRASLAPLRGVPDIEAAQSMCLLCPSRGQNALPHAWAERPFVRSIRQPAFLISVKAESMSLSGCRSMLENIHEYHNISKYHFLSRTVT